MQRTWPDDELRALPLEALDERYRRYRLSVRCWWTGSNA
jgi:hypothetical protein